MPRTIIFTAGILCGGADASFAGRTTPTPRYSSSSAVEAAGLPRDALQDLGVDVEVGVDRVDVVLLLERVDEAQEPAGAVLVERHAGLGLLGHLGGLDLDPCLLERLAHGGEVRRLAHDLVDVVVEADVLSAGVD